MPPDLKIYLLSADTSQNREAFTRSAEKCGADGILDKRDEYNAIRELMTTRLVNQIVVIVDDNNKLGKTYKNTCELIGQAREVHAFADPRVALEQIPRIRPNVVFCDVHMPGIDGFEVAGRLRESQRQNQT